MRALPLLLFLLLLLLLAASAACSVERMPPTLLVRRGAGPSEIHRAVVLPSECASQECRGLEAIATSELAFHGVDIVDLERVNALPRTRSEIDLSTSIAEDGATPDAHRSRKVTVHGPTLSDVDVWTMRDELAALGVDAVVRVRTATIEATPNRVVAMVRVTRAHDASLVWSSVCEVEPSALSTEARAEDRAVRCALKGAFPR